MNLLLLFESDRVPGGRAEFVIDGERAAHLRGVLGSTPGDSVRVGLLDGPSGRGEVLEVTVQQVRLRVELDEPPAVPDLHLVVAVPRARVLARLLVDAASFGVASIVLLRTWRVQKPYLSASLLEPRHYRPLLHRGMMQARVTHEPPVIVEPLFRPFVEDRLAARSAGSLRMVAHPAASTDLATLDLQPGVPVTLAIGPEGGFLPFEIELLAGQGFLPVASGARPLRVETACVALLAQIELLRRRQEIAR